MSPRPESLTFWIEGNPWRKVLHTYKQTSLYEQNDSKQKLKVCAEICEGKRVDFFLVFRTRDNENLKSKTLKNPKKKKVFGLF